MNDRTVQAGHRQGIKSLHLCSARWGLVEGELWILVGIDRYNCCAHSKYVSKHTCVVMEFGAAEPCCADAFRETSPTEKRLGTEHIHHLGHCRSAGAG